MTPNLLTPDEAARYAALSAAGDRLLAFLDADDEAGPRTRACRERADADLRAVTDELSALDTLARERRYAPHVHAVGPVEALVQAARACAEAVPAEVRGEVMDSLSLRSGLAQMPTVQRHAEGLLLTALGALPSAAAPQGVPPVAEPAPAEPRRNAVRQGDRAAVVGAEAEAVEVCDAL